MTNYTYKATIINIVDGDTVDAIVDLGFYTSISTRFRLNGIDTYETNSSDVLKKALGIAAKELLKTLILNKEVQLKSYKADKYGRFLCDITIDNLHINSELVQKGLAVAYFGGTKTI